MHVVEEYVIGYAKTLNDAQELIEELLRKKVLNRIALRLRRFRIIHLRLDYLFCEDCESYDIILYVEVSMESRKSERRFREVVKEEVKRIKDEFFEEVI